MIKLHSKCDFKQKFEKKNTSQKLTRNIVLFFNGIFRIYVKFPSKLLLTFRFSLRNLLLLLDSCVPTIGNR